MADKEKTKELLDRLKPIALSALEAAAPTVPSLLTNPKNYSDWSASDKRNAQLVVAQLMAESLLAMLPAVAVIVPIAVLLTQVVLEHPDALENVNSQQVKAAIADFPNRISEAQGNFQDEKEAVDSTLGDVLSLPKSLKAAALVIMLGACGSASWDAAKYTYSKGQKILEQQSIENPNTPNLPNSYEDKEIPMHVVIGDGLRLRANPSSNSTVDALIYKGERLVVFELSDEWAFVNVLDRPNAQNIGWVHRDYIERLE